MHGFERFVRITHVRHQTERVLQSGFVCRGTYLMKGRTGVIQIFYGFVIIHKG